MNIVRAEQRFHSEHDGVESWHCFSAGAHYDPGNVSHGPLIGVDEHVVAPSAGFDWHAHRGVDIVTVVLSGVLEHRGPDGSRTIGAGEVFEQLARDGIRHREWNASDVEPLRFVQSALRPTDTAVFSVWDAGGSVTADLWHAFVVEGSWQAGDEVLRPGDSVRGEGVLRLDGTGQLLVWTYGDS